MSFKPYFETVNFNNVDTMYANVSPLPMPAFGLYSMPLFSFGNYFNSYSFMPTFSSNTGASYSFGSYSSVYDFTPKNNSSSPTKSFEALTSTPSVSKARNYSYRPVSSATKQKLGPEFLARVKEVAQNINCDYQDLLAVMNSESGLNPAIQNLAGHQAYGLIQFTPDAAREVGTTVDKLVKMSAVEQLDYVEKFYLNARKTRGFGNKKFTAADLYAVTFLPARANRDVLCVKGERWESGRKKGQLKNWYEANTVFDKNGNGKIEKWELQQQMDACRVNENIFVA